MMILALSGAAAAVWVAFFVLIAVVAYINKDKPK